MTTLLIVASVRFYREGLAEVLGRYSEIDVIGTASGRARALALVREHNPHMALLDTATPNGIKVARMIVRQNAPTRVVAIAISEEPADVLSWAEAGICGYVNRDCSIEELVAVIEATARGELRCSPRVAGAMLRHVGRLAWAARAVPASEKPPELTTREYEIIELIDQGWPNKKIAYNLDISPATVKNHIHNILAKLNVCGRGEAAAVVREWEARIGAPRHTTRSSRPPSARRTLDA